MIGNNRFYRINFNEEIKLNMKERKRERQMNYE